MPKFSLNTYNSSLIDKKQTSYQSQNKSNSDHLSYQTKFKYQPNINYLNIFSFDGNIEYSISNIDTNLILTSGTTNATTSELSTDKQDYNLSARLPSIPLLISDLKSPFIRYTNKWTNKKDTNSTNSTDDTLDSTILNNSSVSTNILNIDFTVFNQMKSKNKGTIETSYYNRNKTNSAQGSLFKKAQSIDSQLAYSLLNNKIKNTEYLFIENLDQYLNNDVNISASNLINNYDEKLILNERLANHQTELKLFGPLSIIGNAQYQDFIQQSTTSSNATTTFFNQNKGTAGIKLNLFGGLNIVYNYSIKQTKQNTSSYLTGQEDVLDITYSPFKYENFEVLFNFNREKNWGYGFNEIEKELLLQSSAENIALNIIERNDEVYLSSLNLNIILPVENSEHLERIIFSSEGYFKYVLDQYDSNNTLMINGFLFNIRMEL